ncbi:hypothetical protein [Burkholderia cenocepacia]|uniref:hypothetical protein n=1 Tax=Burkholderia cenocepacia TaxID=95486 RepID=UPI001CF572C0|nr:hypothetical protein [Burkholderia cenocepacia]MCA7966091.1 hypothetical protein [Burkholderia cenocepacia]MDR8058319.1 hypothetical protein [Burkholderia cenocepacia]MDR8061591.1 hypothetical protein [Burkholderia cenocepacia]
MRANWYERCRRNDKETETRDEADPGLLRHHIADAGQAVVSADTTHEHAPDFDTRPRCFVRFPIFGIEVISPRRLDSVFTNQNARRPHAARRRLHGLDDDFVTVEFLAIAFDSLVQRVSPYMHLMLLSRSALYAIALLKRKAEMASRLFR